MNKVLRNMLNVVADKINPETTDGIVKKAFENIPAYLDDIIKSSIKSLHKSVPLEYLGYQFVGPEDEFRRTYRGGDGKAPFDLSHSDVYPIKFLFRYDGEEFENFMLIPYARQANIMTISGTKYVIQPVLTDTVITPDTGQVFVRLLRDKLIFKAESSNFLINGIKDEGIVVWVNPIKTSAKNGELGKVVTSIAIYLLGELGFYGAVDKYVRRNVQPKLNRPFELTDVLMVKAEPEILAKYRDAYDIYEATGVKPARLKLQGEYKPHNIAILVKKDVEKTAFLTNFIFGILYTLSLVTGNDGGDAEEIFEIIHSGNYTLEDEIFKWRRIFGKIAHKGNYSNKKIDESMAMHFDSVRHYLDTIIHKQLKAKGMAVETFFDLIYEILCNYKEWTRSFKTYNSDIGNQYLDVNYYICYGIISGFNSVIHDINKRRQKSDKHNRVIRINEIQKIFEGKWKQTQIYKIVKSDSPNFNITTPDYSGDLKYPKCTALVELQGCGEGIKRSQDSRMPSAALRLSGTDVIFGSILSLNKKKHSPMFKINLYCQIDDAGKIIINAEDGKTVQDIDSKLRQKNGQLDVQNIELLEE